MVEILLSCLNGEVDQIIKDSGLQDENVLIINQCKTEGERLFRNIKVIDSKTRGLSKSRNLAVALTDADICLLADDDEKFYENVCRRIEKIYAQYKADVVIFKVENFGYHAKKAKRLNFFALLKVCSIQISFKKNSIIKNHLTFDERLGSGTKFSCGEESKFLMDCKNAGLKIIYIPMVICTLDEKSFSQWFEGFNHDFFYKRGVITRYIYGNFAWIYAGYFLLSKYRRYKNEISIAKAAKALSQGILRSAEEIENL